MFKNKKIIPVVVVGVLILLAAGLILFFMNPRPVNFNREPYGSLEQALKDASNLSQLTNPEAQKEVVAAIAQSGDVGKCEAAKGLMIEGSDYYQICRDNTFLKRAAAEKNPLECKNIQGKGIDVAACERDTVSLALEKGISPQCGSLSTETGKEFCFSEAVTYEAVRAGDYKLCSSIIGSRDYCEGAARLASILTNGEKEKCSTLSGTLKVGCLEYFEKSVGGKVAGCSAVLKSPLFQDMCRKIGEIKRAVK